MQDADEPTVGIAQQERARSSRSPVSVALLAATACMPIVIAAGFLTDRGPVTVVPGDISVLALRGALDGAIALRPSPPTRAGY